jgi:predicted glycoside hydrolase/deacetylase ChbG (UPF0249 family)
MMNFPNAEDDIKLALAETPNLGLGVHLVLTAGNPLSPPGEIPSIITAENSFCKLDNFINRLNEIDPQQVKSEWRRQIEKFVSLTGRNPTHLDSHHHSSFYTEPLFRVMLELATEYDCAIRQVTSQDEGLVRGLPGELVPALKEYGPRLLAEFGIDTTDKFYASFYDDWATKAELLGILGRLPEDGSSEIMCHPGYSDAALEASSIYNRQREAELKVLTDDEIKSAVQAIDGSLTTFAVFA